MNQLFIDGGTDRPWKRRAAIRIRDPFKKGNSPRFPGDAAGNRIQMGGAHTRPGFLFEF